MSQYPPPPPPADYPPYGQPGGPYQGGPYPGGQYPGGPYPTAPTTSGTAITSLVMGLLLCIPVLTGLAAMLFGFLGIRATSTPNVRGRGLAVAGLVLGIVNVLFWVTSGGAVYQWWRGTEAQREEAKAFVKEVSEGNIAAAHNRCGPTIDQQALQSLHANVRPLGTYKDATVVAINQRAVNSQNRLEITGVAEFANGTRTFIVGFEKINGQWKIIGVDLDATK